MVALSILSPFSSHVSFHHHNNRFSFFPTKPSSLLVLFNRCCSSSSSSSNQSFSAGMKKLCCCLSTRADPNGGGESRLLDDELLRKVAGAKDADQALEMIAESSGLSSGMVTHEECRSIIVAALDWGNADLALSVFSAMRREISVREVVVEMWAWARPDAKTYAVLVRGLAAALRVSDAIAVLSNICRMGVSASGEEVPFGKIVRCPTCKIAIAVAQPQHGIQVASCSKCRYQYELVSGDIVNIDSEEISMDMPTWKKVLRLLRIKELKIPAALHSIVVRTPSGIARTHRFATETVELPAQEGERVTISLAAPSNVNREMGPLKLRAKSPGYNPGEPMCLSNHNTGQVSQLLRAPSEGEKSILLNPSILVPALALLASGDAASGIIDLSIPRLISVAAVASVALGTTINFIILPELSKLPQKTVDAVAIKQQLLSQYDMLQTRIKDLRLDAEMEVWMLARMCQLENKIIAVGEPSYRVRRARVQRVRESLENSLSARIELIESYAKISSMIEIEVEMASDVIAAKQVQMLKENIAKQIQQIMETENLEERWRLQAEANDEVERLLSSQEISTEQVQNL